MCCYNKMETYYEHLKALCEGLELWGIAQKMLKEGSPEGFRMLGEIQTERIKYLERVRRG